MRKIVITSEGFIESKGVYGPVMSPYMETNKEIIKMIARGIEVKEVTPEGEYQKLSISDLGQTKEHTNRQEKKVIVNHDKSIVKNENKNNFNNSKKEKKKNKHKTNQHLEFEVDILESK